MPLIPLRPEAIECPSRLDLLEIEAVMLFPDDPAARQRCIEAGTIEQYLALRPHAPEIEPDDDARPWFYGYLARAPRLSETQAKVRGNLFQDGWLAGAILMRFVSAAAVGADISLGEAKSLTLADLGPRLWDRPPSRSTVENRTWATYKAVAPWWAAWLVRSHQARDSTFPCRTTDLSIFFAIGSDILRRANEIKVPHGAGAVVGDDPWRTSPEIQLPAGKLNFTNSNTR